MSKLVIFRGDAVEHEIHLAGHTVRIGRDNRNEIVLDDKSVSRFHAEVRADADRYFIVDLKSRNGVWVNGQQIKGKAALALGVPVTLGAYELALEDDVSTGPFGDEPPPLSQHTVVSSGRGPAGSTQPLGNAAVVDAIACGHRKALGSVLVRAGAHDPALVRGHVSSACGTWLGRRRIPIRRH